MPHPSPRDQIWLKRNAWFAAEQVPVLREKIAAVFSGKNLERR
jgi:uracil-DNA glycosylase